MDYSIEVTAGGLGKWLVPQEDDSYREVKFLSRQAGRTFGSKQGSAGVRVQPLLQSFSLLAPTHTS